MTPRLAAIVEAARDPHRRAKLTGTEIAELADAAASQAQPSGENDAAYWRQMAYRLQDEINAMRGGAK